VPARARAQQLPDRERILPDVQKLQKFGKFLFSSMFCCKYLGKKLLKSSGSVE